MEAARPVVLDCLAEYWKRNEAVDELYQMGLITAAQRDDDHYWLAEEEREALHLLDPIKFPGR